MIQKAIGEVLNYRDLPITDMKRLNLLVTVGVF